MLCMLVVQAETRLISGSTMGQCTQSTPPIQAWDSFQFCYLVGSSILRPQPMAQQNRTDAQIACSGKERRKQQHEHEHFGADFRVDISDPCARITRASGKHCSWCGHPRFSARTSMTRTVTEKVCTKEFGLTFRPPEKPCTCRKGRTKGCDVLKTRKRCDSKSDPHKIAAF